jgi:phage minor structural protein
MIKIFSAADTDFTSNGEVVISNATKANVRKVDNGDYYLDFECGLEYVDYIVANNIIVAPTPQGDQAFRITSFDATRKKITAKAWHIFYDSANYLIADSYVVDKNCNDALDHLNGATDTQSPFTTLSNVQTIDSYRCVRTSLQNAISVLLERWGGHLVRDNWNIKIMNSIGQDNGVTIQYKKNLKEITAKYDWSNVVTKLLPVGYDGILLDEIYIYSDTQYSIPYTKTVSFEQGDINQEDYEDETAYQDALKVDLFNQATAYLAQNCVPAVTYTLKANIEKITDVGDYVQVYDQRLGLNLDAAVTAFNYDCILGKYTEIEFGSIGQSLSNLMSNVTSQVNTSLAENNVEMTVQLNAAIEAAEEQIWSALGSSYCIYSGDQIMIVDNLPAQDAVNCIRINSAGIAFSQTGINGTFTSAWTIDGTLNMAAINVINLTADLIKGGTLKLGSNLNAFGSLEIYDETNTLIAQMNKQGLQMYGQDGSYILMNPDVGFAGYDRLNNQLYWITGDEFHMQKSVVEEEITLCNKLRFIPIEVYDETDPTQLVNDGIGLVSVL